MEREVVIKGMAKPEQNNDMMEKGYKFKVKGDWKTGDDVDPWSGMPNVDRNTHFFVDRADAEAFAQKQHWPFNKNISGKVVELSHEETHDEFKARTAKEKADKAAKKVASDERKAAELGISVDELKKRRAKQSLATRLKREIASHEEELEKLKAQLAELEG